MKKLFLLLFIIFITNNVYANVYVYYYKDSKEVIFIDDKDSVVVSAEDSSNIDKAILSNNLEYYNLEYDYNYYLLQGNKLILNSSKLADKEIEKNNLKSKKAADNALKESAKNKLISLGLTSDEVDAFIKLENN